MKWQYIAAFVFYFAGVVWYVKLDFSVWRHQKTLGVTNISVVLIQAHMCQKHRLEKRALCNHFDCYPKV